LPGTALSRLKRLGRNPVQGFFDFLKSLGAARMAAMAAVTLALIGFFSFLMIRMPTATSRRSPCCAPAAAPTCCWWT
jgi:hypothetical protein